MVLGVPNTPAAVPRAAARAPANANLPWALEIPAKRLAEATRTNPALGRGLTVARGRVVHPPVAEVFHMPATPRGYLALPERCQ